MKPPNNQQSLVTIDLDQFESSIARSINTALGGGYGLTGTIRLTENQWGSLPEDVRMRIEDKQAEQKLLEAEAEVERQRSEEAFNARVKYWIREGMESTPENVKILIAAVNANPALRDAAPTPEMIDAAVALCRSKLSWRKPQPVAPAPAPTPAPVVRTLENGEPELPLNATEAEMRRASIPQLKDLSKRRGEGLSWSVAPVKQLPFKELPLDADAKTMRAASVEQLRDLSRRRGEAGYR